MRPIGSFFLMVIVALLLRSTALSSLATRGIILDALAFVTVVWALRHGDAWGASFAGCDCRVCVLARHSGRVACFAQTDFAFSGASRTTILVSVPGRRVLLARAARDDARRGC